MSEFKNYVPRKQYKERSQPTRKHQGFLEKKKDYKRRAKIYHSKEDKLNQLRLKAGLKNPDEFYFKMINSKQIGKSQEVIFEDHQQDDDIPEEEIRKIIKTQNQQIVKVQSLKDQYVSFILSILINIQRKLMIQKDNYIQLMLLNKINEYYLLIMKINLIIFKIKLNNRMQYYNQNEIEDEETVKNASRTMKGQYKKLADKIDNYEKMRGIYMKLDFDKQFLSKGKRKLKQTGNGNKQYKFFNERKR